MPYRYLPIFEPLIFTMTNSYTFYIIYYKDYFKYFAELWICWSKLDITKNSSNLLIFSKLHGTIPATALGKTWDTNWREQTREVPTNWCFGKVLIINWPACTTTEELKALFTITVCHTTDPLIKEHILWGNKWDNWLIFMGLTWSYPVPISRSIWANGMMNRFIEYSVLQGCGAVLWDKACP